MTPVFSHGSLRLYLLSLLAEQPRHGYELIQALSDRFGGTYSPSAGTIYPRLAKLEEEGLVTKSADGRKTVYEITDAGRTELLAREGELGRVESEVTESVRRLADEVRSGVSAAMKGLRADLASAARQTKADASVGPTPADTGTHVASTRALREADLVLNEFRHQLRADLRTQAAGPGLPGEVVTDLRSQLDAVRASILATRP
ncbi:PadR family transcriptional regulator [Cryobacterium melibiosiphilum]|uniref:PadR family transcriptional regulator n=1 Tax=Cryobacterium melibiosiphilum TaxID=995039 RepID=A0A3A5MI50_9MICO|nr:PadR family transcriptional regulator [Cryobacterium melibiosiphilum]RJT89082.1 PadR family transcriptional regulator [Cryobacterium melibiosiphilum]